MRYFWLNLKNSSFRFNNCLFLFISWFITTTGDDFFNFRSIISWTNQFSSFLNLRVLFTLLALSNIGANNLSFFKIDWLVIIGSNNSISISNNRWWFSFFTVGISFWNHKGAIVVRICVEGFPLFGNNRSIFEVTIRISIIRFPFIRDNRFILKISIETLPFWKSWSILKALSSWTKSLSLFVNNIFRSIFVIGWIYCISAFRDIWCVFIGIIRSVCLFILWWNNRFVWIPIRVCRECFFFFWSTIIGVWISFFRDYRLVFINVTVDGVWVSFFRDYWFIFIKVTVDGVWVSFFWHYRLILININISSVWISFFWKNWLVISIDFITIWVTVLSFFRDNWLIIRTDLFVLWIIYGILYLRFSFLFTMPWIIPSIEISTHDFRRFIKVSHIHAIVNVWSTVVM